MKIMKLIALALLITAIIPVLTGCPMPVRTGDFPPHLMISYTADNAGEMFPCGCRVPLGGMSRRGGILTQENPYPQLIVDAGSFAGGNTGYDQFTAEYILKMMALMGYHAVNLGRKESSQPVDVLRNWDTIAQGTLLSANLVDSEGLPVTRRSLIREIGGVKIGITGMTEQGSRPVNAANLPTVLEPDAPLNEVMADFNSQGVQFVVLLADAATDILEVLLGKVRGIDLVIQGQGFNPSDVQRSHLLENGTRLVRIGGTGRYLGRLRLDFEPDGTVTGEEVIRLDMDSNTPTLSSISEVLVQFKTEIRQRRDEFIGDPTNPFQRSQSPEMIDVLTGYTGEAFCMKCHPGYGLEQQFVGHSSAWIRLPEADQTNQECLECHSTGYGAPTGMKDPFLDSHMRGITCEACHGPASLHVRQQTILEENLDESMMLPYVDSTGLPFTREVPAETCLRCHTQEWSPNFNYDEWVLKVNHYTAHERSQMNPEAGSREELKLPEELMVPDPE